MKKILFSFMLIIIMSLAVPTLFANTNEKIEPKYIIDNAHLLTSEEVLQLEIKSAEIKEKYNFDTVVLTVDDIGNSSPMTYSSNFYHKNNYSENGIIFLISMGERDWDISTFNYGREVFTDDYGLDYMVSKIVPHLSDGDYNKGFSNFLYYADTFLLEAESGTPYSAENKILPKNKIMLIILTVAFIISALIIFFMIRSMNTKKPKNFAHEYVKQESINMTERNDTFLYRTVTRTARAKKSSSGSGGGGRSGGRSGKF